MKFVFYLFIYMERERERDYLEISKSSKHYCIHYTLENPLVFDISPLLVSNVFFFFLVFACEYSFFAKYRLIFEEIIIISTAPTVYIPTHTTAVCKKKKKSY